MLEGGKTSFNTAPLNYVDVRDVARAHIRAAEVPEAQASIQPWYLCQLAPRRLDCLTTAGPQIQYPATCSLPCVVGCAACVIALFTLALCFPVQGRYILSVPNTVPPALVTDAIHAAFPSIMGIQVLKGFRVSNDPLFRLEDIAGLTGRAGPSAVSDLCIDCTSQDGEAGESVHSLDNTKVCMKHMLNPF